MPLVEQAQQRFIVSGHIAAVFVVAANTLQALFTGFGQQIADDFQEDRHIDWFLNERFHSGGNRPLALIKLRRDDDGGDEWIQLCHRVEDFPAVVRAEIQVQNDQIGWVGSEMVQCVNSVPSWMHVIVFRLKQLLERFANGMIVIYYKQFRFHKYSLVALVPVSLRFFS